MTTASAAPTRARSGPGMAATLASTPVRKMSRCDVITKFVVIHFRYRTITQPSVSASAASPPTIETTRLPTSTATP